MSYREKFRGRPKTKLEAAEESRRRNLFYNKAPGFISNNKSDNTLSEVESERFIKQYIKQQTRYIPEIDYADPSTFCFYGSAERYYVDSIDRVSNTYPYDGSRAEKLEWFLSSSYLDIYLLEHKYPKTTGFVNFSSGSSGYGSVTTDDNAFVLTDKPQYIYFTGGPHKNTIWNPAKKRENNLKLDSTQGNTVEFWLRKDQWLNAGGTAGYGPGGDARNEVVCDIYTPGATGNETGRMIVSLLSGSSADGSPFRLTYQSGSTGYSNKIGNLACADVADGKWHHYAVTVAATGSNTQYEFYVDGKINNRFIESHSLGPVNRHFAGTIGALGATVETFGGLGYGKLSGSIDEFRFWKSTRTEKEIGRYWHYPIHGGTDNDHSNASLGLYYKFNEGVIGDDDYDKVVLDYSGRINNGTFVGYDATCRSISSAINLSKNTPLNFLETKDPIINKKNSLVENFREEYRKKGRAYDGGNTSSLLNSIPGFMRESDQDLFPELMQIISYALDDLFIKIKFLPKIKDYTYNDFFNKKGVTKRADTNDFLLGCENEDDYNFVGAHGKPWIQHILEHFGMVTTEIFPNAEIFEYFSNRGESLEFEQNISEVKKAILSNIHKNLIYIYNTKGTEQSFRNLIRCFGIDDDVIKLNTYAKNDTYYIKDNPTYTSLKRKTLSFADDESHNVATLYPFAVDADEKAFFAGSSKTYPITLEANILFPDNSKFQSPIKKSSLFGMHSVQGTTKNDLTWLSLDSGSIQVYSNKHNEFARGAQFVLTSSKGIFQSVTSSYMPRVYDNKHWHISVRIGKQSEINFNILSESAPSNYMVEFSGSSYELDIPRHSFYVTSNISRSSYEKLLLQNKSVYIGAHLRNFSGSVLNNTDCKMLGFNVWHDRLSSEELKLHAQNPALYGRQNPQDIVLHDAGLNLRASDSLILRWQFENLTASASDGTIKVIDYSSGSLDRGQSTALGDVVGYKYPGLGKSFSNQEKAINQEFLSVCSFNNIDNYYSSDRVQIKTSEVSLFNPESKPVTYYYAFEKSMYQAISSEMINFFSGMVGFNDLMGEPVNKYRDEYKLLGKLRERFFARVENDIDLDKYIQYYKWIDSSLGHFLNQITPASSEFSDKIRDIVESHMLERNKYQYRAPTIEFKDANEKFWPIKGINEQSYDWEHGHAPMIFGSSTPGVASSLNNVLHPGSLQAGHTLTIFIPAAANADGVNKTWIIKIVNSFSGAVSGMLKVKHDASDNTMATRIIGALNQDPSSKGVAWDWHADVDSADHLVASLPSPGDVNLALKKVGVSGNSAYIDAYDFEGMHWISSTHNNGNADSAQLFTGGSEPVAVILGSESQNCLWWKDRANRRSSLSVSNETNIDRETIRRVSVSDVSGSTYALRRFAKPYRFSVDRQITTGEINNASANKIDEFWKIVHSGKEITLKPADIYESLSCEDLLEPSKKKKYTAKIDTNKTAGYYDGDSDLLFPFSLYSSSAGTDFPGLKSKLQIANNHLGGTEGTLQSTYTEQHIGGMPHRHVAITTATDLADWDSSGVAGSNRPEAYVLSLGAEDNALTMSMGAWQFTPRSRFYRDAVGATPYSIKNIKFNTSSAFLGNYNRDYEIVMTNSRLANNNDFIDNEGYNYTVTISSVTGLPEFNVPQRQRTSHVIVNRFSAPGGPETMSPFGLDRESEEFSVYNSINYRNSLVRTVQKSLLSEHSGRFGFRTSSTTQASIHMVNRNLEPQWRAQTQENFNTKALLLDGTDDYLQINSTRDLFLNNNEISVFAWIKHPTVTNTNSHVIFSIHSSAGANRHLFVLRGTAGTDGTLQFYQDSTTWQKISNTRIDDNSWHLVGFVYEGTNNTLKFYVDGISQGDALTVTNIASIMAASDFVSIGQEYDAGPDESDFFNGYIADLSIWTRALTGKQALEIYTDGYFKGPHNLLAHTAKNDLAAWYRMGNGDNGGSGGGYAADSATGTIYSMHKYPREHSATPLSASASAIVDIQEELPGIQIRVVEKNQNNNAFVTHPIPRTDYQYSWITASVSDSVKDFIKRNDFGHTHHFSLNDIEGKGYYSCSKSQIGFVSASDIGVYTDTTVGAPGVYNPYFRKTSDGRFYALPKEMTVYANINGWMPVDFSRLNTIVYEPVSSNILGHSVSEYTGTTAYGLTNVNYINQEMIRGRLSVMSSITSSHGPEVYVAGSHASAYGEWGQTILNSIILNRQGPYGWPSWKQLRGAQHPIARDHRKNNIISIVHRSASHQECNEALADPTVCAGTPNISSIMNYKFDYNTDLQNLDAAPMLRSRKIKNYKDIPVTSKFKPVTWTFYTNGLRTAVDRAVSQEQWIKYPTQGTQEYLWNSDVYLYELRRMSDHEEGTGTIEEERVKIQQVSSFRTTYQNDLSFFANKEITDLLQLNDFRDHSFVGWLSTLSRVFSNTGRDDFELNYIETLYPREINTYTKNARNREKFDFFGWKSTRSERNIVLSGSTCVGYGCTAIRSSAGDLFPTSSKNPLDYKKTNGLLVDALDIGSILDFSSVKYIKASSWPLDARSNFASQPTNTNNSFQSWMAPQFSFVDDFLESRDQGSRYEGHLQNDYSIFAMGHNGLHGTPPVSLLYNRRTPQSGSSTNDGELLAGEARWQAAEQSGRNPFYDSYDSYNKDIKLVGQDYSIIPEFRISEFVEDITNKERGNFTQIGNDWLSLTGAIYHSSSGETQIGTQFFKTYSTSDFMKYFNIVQDSLKSSVDSVEPYRLTLKCQAVIKFLPYRGFYPVERAMQIGELFSRCYMPGPYTAENYDYSLHDDNSVVKKQESALATKVRANLQQSIKPFMAPGILFNSIKAGVAVDYPIFPTDFSSIQVKMDARSDFITSYKNITTTALRGITGITGSILNASKTGSTIGTPFDTSPPRLTAANGTELLRIDFDDLLEPGNIFGQEIHDNEPHPSASLFYGNKNTERILDRPFLFGKLNQLRTKTRLGIDRFTMNQEKFVSQMQPYSKAMKNFAAESVKFFLEDETLTTIESAKVYPHLKNTETYKMRVYLRNKDLVMYDRHSAFGPPVDEGREIVYGKTTRSTTNNPVAYANGELRFAEDYPLPSGSTAATLPGFYLNNTTDSYTVYVKYCQTAVYDPADDDKQGGVDGEWWYEYATGSTLTLYVDVGNPRLSATALCRRTRDAINRGKNHLGPMVGAQITYVSASNPQGIQTLVPYTTHYRTLKIDQETAGFAGNNAVFDAFSSAGGGNPTQAFFNNFVTETELKLRGGADASTTTEIAVGNTSAMTSHGFMPYVPPFLDRGAEPYVELSYVASKDGNHTLEEIFDGLSYKYVNFHSPHVSFLDSTKNPNYRYSMSLSASLNLAIKTRYFDPLEAGQQNPGQDSRTTHDKWSIQTRWETPVLNFKAAPVDALRLDTGVVETITGPSPWKSRHWGTYYTKSALVGDIPYLTASRGMWHQFGQIPENQEGYVLSVENAPDMNKKHQLAHLVGFVPSPAPGAFRKKKIGSLAKSKEISEAVVAIPYYSDDGCSMNYFTISNQMYLRAWDKLRSLETDPAPAQTKLENVVHQFHMMQKYIFPPRFDFLTYDSEIRPLMYVFEFQAKLNQDDLRNIWQNVSPESLSSGAHARTSGFELNKHLQMKEDVQYVSHFLDPENAPFDSQLRENFLNEKVKWLVFKVKLKSEKSYEEVRKNSLPGVAEEGLDISATNVVDYRKSRPAWMPAQRAIPEFSYNWPYDYFSLVELIKLDAKVDFFPKKSP